ncbi:hypothetical protein GCM10007170_45400 [Arthrobacter liuii]|uniref:Uncharacterized protein n=1 Tax=Arthrobacter liuii TaxID=1476996 RepID=A0ABQ2AYY8_9MICC|nr:hypothetical protein GCM10007170_45400 [Arthrobacter liuii]
MRLYAPTSPKGPVTTVRGSTQPVLTGATLQRSHDRTATITAAAAVLRASPLHTIGAQAAPAKREVTRTASPQDTGRQERRPTQRGKEKS